MGSCRASGKVVKFGDRLRKRNETLREIMDIKLKSEGRMKKPKLRSQNKPNKHRIVPVKARGFHEDSFQMSMKRIGIHKRYKVDKEGTITRLEKGE